MVVNRESLIENYPWIQRLLYNITAVSDLKEHKDYTLKKYNGCTIKIICLILNF